jgi:hypothetical protein
MDLFFDTTDQELEILFSTFIPDGRTAGTFGLNDSSESVFIKSTSRSTS